MTRTGKSKPDWPAVAEAFAARISHGALHPAAMLRAFAEYRRETHKGGRPSRWALAFSGGADSLALLLIFWAEGPGRWGRDFVVLHFNHRLRGKAADADEKFCAQVCAALGVTFVAGRWHKAPKAASEAAARTARFEFFGREMGRRKIRLLWLAHQQDDIAESLLMRLARGSGTGGLAAPRPVQAMGEGRLHLRPMLSLKKADLTAALKKAGAGWREDASNATDDHFRNRIRRRVLPAWIKAAGRDALAGAALSRELLDDDDAALEAWLDELKPLDRRGRLDLGRLAGKPRALVRRALHRWLLAVRPETDLSRQGFNQLLAAVERGRDTRFSLGAKGFAVVRRGGLGFRKA
ncbi:tRNA lysidine(34) synthetase TilS [Opitutus sp. GAS368]|uniref:tRNA lysidine(34) synthetase TilS n=1 Tax=Opitutus sp. GAS368 TaxID=1882749 RepID=UPI00087B941E|nr:tRNA lysidine(34) synthetase TilS [Opitutus sp. GAS368]SDR66495.1 tRNA(Ile)-lysidine synthase [Opitutus sp. GAS368]